jgi:hypothetical protein
MRRHKQQLSLVETNKKDIELDGDKSDQGNLAMKEELGDKELDAATGGLVMISNIPILTGLLVPRR